jgi:hypothetical protein
MITTLSKIVYRSGSAFSSIVDYHVAPEVGLPILEATSVTGTAAASDLGAGGTFDLIGANQWTYTPANKSQSVTLRVTDDVETDDKTLAVTATLPMMPDTPFEWDTPSNSKVIVAKDFSPRFRIAPKRGYVANLSFTRRTIMDVSVMKTFEQFHDINKEFYFVDPEIEQTILVRFDSSVKVRTAGGNDFAFSAILKAYKLASPLAIPTAYV